MSTDTVLIKTLDFTASVGKPGPHDDTFSDVFIYGGFPFKQDIKGIAEIDVYGGTDNAKTAVIVGLTVKYNLKNGSTTAPIHHGVVSTKILGQVSVSDDQILVGVFGQLKDAAGAPNDGRVASIGFVLFDEKTAELGTEGPFKASDINLGKVWANFGSIIALQGTKGDGVGLTSLGFVETTVSGN